MDFFNIIHEDITSQARVGILRTAHGDISTPIFMPVGTAGSVKAVEQRNLYNDIKAEIILSNTYHLYLRPGCDVLTKTHGLHNFIHWDKPILTDSGGFQVYSLSKIRKINDEGVTFSSHIDGTKHFFTPENIIDIQTIIGSDVIMPLDECTPFNCGYNYTKESIDRTHMWLKRSIDHFISTRANTTNKQYLFGIIQGSIYKELRKQSVDFITNINVSGYSIGGVCHTKDKKEDLYNIAEYVCSLLPKDKPRYFMGVGTPQDILLCIQHGVDMFDCVHPTRCARHGKIYTTNGIVHIKNKKWEKCCEPLDIQIDNYVTKNYTKAYLHHLIRSQEILGYQIASIQNLSFYLWLIKKAREKIKNNSYKTWLKEILPIINTEL